MSLTRDRTLRTTPNVLLGLLVVAVLSCSGSKTIIDEDVSPDVPPTSVVQAIMYAMNAPTTPAANNTTTRTPAMGF